MSPRRIVLGVAASVLGSLAFAVPSQAATTATCAVTGQATTNPSVQLSAGSGSYSFDAGAGAATALKFNCLGVNGSAQFDVENFSVSSSGTYANSVCGTGTATSTTGGKGGTINGATITTTAPTGGATDLRPVWWHGLTGAANWTFANQLDLSYAITFAGGQGALTFLSPALAGTAEVTGGGPISITATGPGTPNTPPGYCTTTFQVVGALQGVTPSVP
jgi:hypothetical protein